MLDHPWRSQFRVLASVALVAVISLMCSTQTTLAAGGAPPEFESQRYLQGSHTTTHGSRNHIATQ